MTTDSAASDAAASPRSWPTASVIIPAHNEQDRIGRTLRTLLATSHGGEFDVIVVCNGCDDATAERARDVPGVRVLERARPSKIAALRAGDDASDVFPRIYLDGDVALPTATARALRDALSRSTASVAGVPGRVDLSEAPLGVQLFLEFRTRLPVFEEGIIGAGVYAMSREGRARFGPWPEISGDDQFVLRLFTPQERTTVTTASTVVSAPPDLRTVIRRGIRVRRGNQALSRAGMPPPAGGFGQACRRSLRSLRGLASLVVFLVATAIIRVGARLPVSDDWT